VAAALEAELLLPLRALNECGPLGRTMTGAPLPAEDRVWRWGDGVWVSESNLFGLNGCLNTCVRLLFVHKMLSKWATAMGCGDELMILSCPLFSFLKAGKGTSRSR
jgi:hypothetical protein